MRLIKYFIFVFLIFSVKTFADEGIYLTGIRVEVFPDESNSEMAVVQVINLLNGMETASYSMPIGEGISALRCRLTSRQTDTLNQQLSYYSLDPISGEIVEFRFDGEDFEDRSLSISPQGRYLVATYLSGHEVAIAFMDTQTGEVQHLQIPDIDTFMEFFWSEENIFGLRGFDDEEAFLVLYDFSRRESFTIRSANLVESVAGFREWSPNGRWLPIRYSHGPVLSFIDTTTMTEITIDALRGRRIVSWVDEGHFLLSVSLEMELALFDIEQQEFVWQRSIDINSEYLPDYIRFLPEISKIAFRVHLDNGEEALHLLDALNGNDERLLTTDSEIVFDRLSPDNRYLPVWFNTDLQGTLHLIDTTTGELIDTAIPAFYPSETVLQWSPDSQRFVYNVFEWPYFYDIPSQTTIPLAPSLDDRGYIEGWFDENTFLLWRFFRPYDVMQFDNGELTIINSGSDTTTSTITSCFVRQSMEAQ